jgi:hypothetical protein
VRESHAQFRHIARRYVESVEPVSDVDLQEVDETIVGVGEADLSEDTLESMAKLHGFAGGKASRVGIYVCERVVDDSPWAAVSLRNHSHGPDTKAQQRSDLRIRQDYPKALGNHVGNFHSEKDLVLLRRRMTSTGHGVVTALERPRLSGKNHWCTIAA